MRSSVGGASAGSRTSPYLHASPTLGERNSAEAALYAAGPRHYLAAMPDNLPEGWLLGALGRPEKRLFPGFVALALTLTALWPGARRTAFAYAALLAVAVNLSFAVQGASDTSGARARDRLSWPASAGPLRPGGRRCDRGPSQAEHPSAAAHFDDGDYAIAAYRFVR